MKAPSTAIAFVVVGLGVQACTIMDGEHTLMNKQQADTKETRAADTSHSGAQPTPDAGVPEPDAAVKPAPAVSTNVVQCDNKQCTGSTPYCCASKDLGTCVDANTTYCPGSRFLMRCDEEADCANGEVCCAYSDNERWESYCTTAAKCTMKATTAAQEWRVMCRDDSDCKDGTKCWDWVQDYGSVRVNITMGICTLEPPPAQ